MKWKKILQCVESMPALLTCVLCPTAVGFTVGEHSYVLCADCKRVVCAPAWGIVDYYPGHPVTRGEHSFRGLI